MKFTWIRGGILALALLCLSAIGSVSSDNKAYDPELSKLEHEAIISRLSLMLAEEKTERNAADARAVAERTSLDLRVTALETHQWSLLLGIILTFITSGTTAVFSFLIHRQTSTQAVDWTKMQKDIREEREK